MTNAEARFNKIHTRKVYACLAVTCHLHFWQNDRDFLSATVVTRGWNGYRNKSQHRKSTLEKKILPPFQQGFEPATFQSRVRRSNHWAIPAPPGGRGGSKCSFVRVFTVIPPRLSDPCNFITVLLVTREAEQTTLLFRSAACIYACEWPFWVCWNNPDCRTPAVVSIFDWLCCL